MTTAEQKRLENLKAWVHWKKIEMENGMAIAPELRESEANFVFEIEWLLSEVSRLQKSMSEANKAGDEMATEIKVALDILKPPMLSLLEPQLAAKYLLEALSHWNQRGKANG